MDNKFLRIAAIAVLMPMISYANEQETEHNHDEHNHQNKEHQSEHKAHDEHHHDDHHAHDNKVEKIQVRASRLGRIVTESATRTEIINAEEIQEKAIMRPGNISMLVAETGGVRLQTTSPALGSANIRLQGLYGRYTQLLSDGLPLYGGQAPAIGLLQIPPTDLANVEIIKGAASSLYGGSALGGVINLISRTPSEQSEGEVLVNVTSKQGLDLTSYFAKPLTKSTKGSITAGIHHQRKKDLDSDGWIDMAGYERGSVRPRLYWEGEDNANLYVTMGLMSESRIGGTLGNATLPDGNPFPQSQETNRSDLGFIFGNTIGEELEINMRGSAMQQNHDHEFGLTIERDEHQSYLLESTLSGYSNDIAWLVGIAYQKEEFNSETFPEFDFSYQVPGLLSQIDIEINESWSTSLSARADWHSEYGNQLSPRISALYKPENWTIRAAYGKGFYAPTPFIEDIDETGLSRIAPSQNLQAEQASTASIDVSTKLGSLEASTTLFASDVENATELQWVDTGLNLPTPQFSIVNNSGETHIRGAELLLRYRWNDLKLTGSYLYTDASQETGDFSVHEPLNLTPRHSAGLVLMWEDHGSHLLGFEAYYTGTQHLDDNPFRNKSEAYWHLGLLGQITVGRVSWFVNFENLLNVRQTKIEPLLLPQQAPNGRWTTDIWSRNDGVTVNAGIRVQFDE